MDSLINIVYLSRADDSFRSRDLRHALKLAASQYNGQHDITGLLIYSRGIFVQVIEGPETAVRSLYADICVDSRHSEIELLCDAMIPLRRFSEWSMAVVDTDELANADVCTNDRVAAVRALSARAQSAPVLGHTYIEAFLDPSRLLSEASAQK
jgi:hypothetical protein